MNKQEQINALQFRIERIEAKLAEQHIPNNFGKCSEKPNSCEPDYTHLLPEGYEFCTEQDAEKWVKVREIIDEIGGQSKIGYVWQGNPMKNPGGTLKPYYRPIRPIPLKESVMADPDYTHLLPEGYEFCTEQDAEKWVKVEMATDIPENNQQNLGYLWYSPISASSNHYRPIRHIAYHIAVHEAVTAEPDPYTIEKHGDGWAIYKGRDSMHHGANLGQIHDDKLAQYIGGLLKGFKDAELDPYQVDWSNAPEWADVHCFDANGKGNWYGVKRDEIEWYRCNIGNSEFTLPTGLDWKQSKRLNPKLK